jgi:hypothetical protein
MTTPVMNEESTAIVPSPSARSVTIQAMSVAVPTGFPASDRKVPLVIERDQAYFWNPEWQEAVREAMADVLAGEFVLFDSDDPADVARWLLTAED